MPHPATPTEPSLALVSAIPETCPPAEGMLCSTLTRRRRVLGADHPDSLGSADKLAEDLLELGEHEQTRNWKS